MNDLAEVRKSLVERGRSSGVEKRQAERLAEDSVRRVADRKDRGEGQREKPRQ